MDGIDTGIFAVLEADRVSTADGSLGSLGVTGIHHGNPPKDAQTPFVRFQQMSAPVSSSMGNNGVDVVEAVYMVVCNDDGQDQLRAGTVARRIKTLLHKQTLDCSPSEHMRTLWDRDLDLPEHDPARPMQGRGGNYRVWVYE